MKSNFNKTKRFAPKNNKKRNLGGDVANGMGFVADLGRNEVSDPSSHQCIQKGWADNVKK